MSSYFQNELSSRWKLSNINEGDTVLLHSNTKRLFLEFKSKKIKFEPSLIINSFLDLIGSNGTLLMPLFNFDFTRGIEFNIKHTVSRMGTITEHFRKNYKIIRTAHPIYSFGVIGKNMENFKILENKSAYSDSSPFALLKKLNGKISILDLDDQNSMTFYHHVEEMNNVSWRYHKNFRGNYIDYDGIKKIKEYSIFVRNLEYGVKTNVNPVGELLWKNGYYFGDKPLIKSGLRTISAQKIYSFVDEIIKKGLGEDLLYSKVKKTI
jgi:aminoglycoside 3-N-acetyltransferase